MKTVCPQGRVGSNPTLSVGQAEGLPRVLSYNKEADVQASVLSRSTQEAEGTPLERVQVVNSGARVQIPPSPLALIKARRRTTRREVLQKLIPKELTSRTLTNKQ